MSEPKDPPETFDKAYVETLRNEAAGHRLKAQETQQKLDAVTAERDDFRAKFETADAARVTAESAALEAKTSAESRIVNVELKAAAVALGLIDPDDLRLLDASALKLNDKGEVDGLADALGKLQTAKPHLFKPAANPANPPAPPTGTTNPNPPPPSNPPALKLATDMDQAEYAKAYREMTGTAPRRIA
jgi:hypothetical protein